jgi:hypothetical protein
VRKMAMMVAVLMLAGCDGGKPATPAQVPSTDSTAEAPTPASQQWTIRVHLKEALSDMTYWLVEHHYPSYVVKVDGREVSGGRREGQDRHRRRDGQGPSPVTAGSDCAAFLRDLEPVTSCDATGQAQSCYSAKRR